MIPRYRRYLPVLIFLLLATPLLAGFVMPESAQESLEEARTRAPAPPVPHTRDEIAALPRQVDDYLKDRFGLRKQMIRLNANLTKRLLREGNELVLVGRHGRMFYLRNESVRQSAGLVRRDRQVIETADFLAAMRDALTKRGTRLLVASPPNAATIYQDDLPPWARRNGRATEYDVLLAALAARGINAVDLRPAVGAARSKGPAYFLYDTHWTLRGAIAGFNAVVEADGHPEWRIDAAVALASWTRPGGDLARMIGVSDDVAELSEQLALPPAAFPPGSRVDLTAGPFPSYVTTSDRPGKTIMIIGDSFTTTTATTTSVPFPPMLVGHVGRVVWQHHNSCGFDWKLIDRFQPDEVWWMPTERLFLCDANVHPDGFPSAEKTVTR
jgi:alginate O-acetyltransferase complex protein AlgJ